MKMPLTPPPRQPHSLQLWGGPHDGRRFDGCDLPMPRIENGAPVIPECGPGAVPIIGYRRPCRTERMTTAWVAYYDYPAVRHKTAGLPRPQSYCDGVQAINNRGERVYCGPGCPMHRRTAPPG